MSINLYQTGVSGLLAAQQQLATTGHNVANVNTEGYSRQRAEQSALDGNINGGNFIGSGTYVQDITRIYDQFSYKEQLLNKSSLGNAQSINLDLNQLNQITSLSTESISGSVNRLYQAINGISDNPNDIGLRNIALSQAEVLASDFNNLNNSLEQLEKSANDEIEQMAKKVSQISYELAKINEQVLQSKGLAITGQPNDLLDKRDQLVTELGEYTSVNTLFDNNGVMTVMIGNSTTLVAGTTALTLSVQAGNPDSMQTELKLNGSNSAVNLDATRLGGAIAAKFEYRDEHIPQVRNELNRLSMSISETFNTTQSTGLGLNGKQGLNIFTDINSVLHESSRVLDSSKNSGNLKASITITDVSILPSNDFTVDYDGTHYLMTNHTNGEIITLGTAGLGTYDTGFGFEFNEVTGSPSINDTFKVRPTENSAALMSVELGDPKGIAASSAVEVEANDNNVSNGAVNIINVSDPELARSFTKDTNSSLTVDVFQNIATGDFDYRIYDAANPPPAATLASGSFSPGLTATVGMPPAATPPAFQIEISGNHIGNGSLAREEFTISDAFGTGNSTNASLMAATQEQQLIGAGKQTFNQTLSIVASEVGSNAASAEIVEETAEVLFTQSFNRNQSKSGVNLDEEAANMLKYQQAYQASSQIISIASTIFDTLLAAAR